MIAPGARGGFVGLVRQPDRIEYDPIRGQTRWAVWRALDMGLINQQAAVAQSLLLPHHILSTGTTHTIEIEIIGGSTDPQAQVAPTDRWEMPPNEIQKSVWQHNKALQIGGDIIAIAQQQIDAGQTYDQFVDYCNGLDPNPAAGLSSDAEAALEAAYDLVASGSTHFALGQYVLRHVSNVSQNYLANIADLNVERLYTTQQLLMEVTDPVLWNYPLPAPLVYRIRNLVPPPVRTGYLWAWRKLPSAVVTLAGGRIEHATEYWLEQWSTWLYSQVS